MIMIDAAWIIFGLLMLGLILLILAVNIYKNNNKIIKNIKDLNALELRLEHRIEEIEKRISKIENTKNNAADALAGAIDRLRYIDDYKK